MATVSIPLTKRFESRRASRAFVAAALSVFVLMGTLAYVYGAPASNALLNLLDGKAWFSDDENGVVMLANGASGVVDTRVKIPGGENGELRVLRVGKHSIVINDRTGQASRLDLSNLQISVSKQIAGKGVDVIALGSRMLVVNKAKGSVEVFNASSLTPLSKLSFGNPLTRAVVDSEGVAWVADAKAGQLISVHYDESTKKLVRGSVKVNPGPQFELAAVDGAPTLVDLGAQSIVTLKNRTPAKPVSIPLRSNESPAISRSIEGKTLPIAANSAGVLVLATPDQPSRTDLGRPGNEFGPPVTFGDRIYVPDLTAGELLILDTAGNMVESSRKIGNGPFSLRVEEGFLWVDDTKGEGAFVAGPDGKFRQVDKGREEVPDNVVEPAPVDLPEPISDPDRADDPNPPDVSPVPGPDAPPPPPAPASSPTAPEVAPDAPASVTAVAGNQSAVISWTQPTSYPVWTGGLRPVPLDYKIQWTDRGRTQEKIVHDALETTVEGLTNGTTYSFSVSALNSAGEGPARKSEPATPSSEVPGPPTAVAAKATASGEVNISWKAANGRGRPINGYSVSASEGSGAAQQIASGLTATTFRAAAGAGGLELGKSYTFTVVALNDLERVSIESAPSAEIRMAKAAAAPGGFTATGSSQTVQLSWTAPNLNGGTLVDYVVTGTNGLQSKNLTGTSTSFTGLSNGVAYTFGVTARTSANGLTMTGASASLAATPGTAPAISVSANAAGDRTINWSYSFNANSSGAATCTVFRSGTQIWGPAPCQGSVSGSTGGLAYSTNYEIFARAQNQFGTTDSNRVSPRTNDAPPPPPPPPSVSLGLGKSEPCDSRPSATCRRLTVTKHNFPPGSRTVSCQNGSGQFYSYSTPNDYSAVCHYGVLNSQVWVVVNGVESNRVSF